MSSFGLWVVMWFTGHLFASFSFLSLMRPSSGLTNHSTLLTGLSWSFGAPQSGVGQLVASPLIAVKQDQGQCNATDTVWHQRGHDRLVITFSGGSSKVPRLNAPLYLQRCQRTRTWSCTRWPPSGDSPKCSYYWSNQWGKKKNKKLANAHLCQHWTPHQWLHYLALVCLTFQSQSKWRLRQRKRKRCEKWEMRWCETRERTKEMQTGGLGWEVNIRSGSSTGYV